MEYIVTKKSGIEIYGRSYKAGDKIHIYNAHHAQALISAGHIQVPGKPEAKPQPKGKGA